MTLWLRQCSAAFPGICPQASFRRRRQPGTRVPAQWRNSRRRPRGCCSSLRLTWSSSELMTTPTQVRVVRFQTVAPEETAGHSNGSGVSTIQCVVNRTALTGTHENGVMQLVCRTLHTVRPAVLGTGTWWQGLCSDVSVSNMFSNACAPRGARTCGARCRLCGVRWRQPAAPCSR